MPGDQAARRSDDDDDSVALRNEDDTELLLCLLAEVEEQIAESRACVHGASNKLEESKEFEAASTERQKEAQLSEATRRKLQRRAQIINAEVKSELAKAVAQLRHSSHHYRHVKGEIERALRQRDRRVMDYARAEGRAEALSEEVSENKNMLQRLHKDKDDAEMRARRLQDEVEEQRKARTLAETHVRTLSATLEQEEESLRREQADKAEYTTTGAGVATQLQETRELLEAAETSNWQLTKSRDLLVAQLRNSKEVVARITADNLMFLNKIKHCETKLEQAVKEREVVRIDLNTSDNRWFEHMRDELQKVTQSHLDAIDEYEARLQLVKDEAQGKTNDVSEQLRMMADTLHDVTVSRDQFKELSDTTREQLRELSTQHTLLSAQHTQLTEAHSALVGSHGDLQKSYHEASRQNGEDETLITLLKGRVMEASSTVAEASREVDERRREASEMRDTIERLSEEKNIILKGKHLLEQQCITGQAENDVLGKKNRALESEITAVREEKRRVERQLSLTVGPVDTPSRSFGISANSPPAKSALQALTAHG